MSEPVFLEDRCPKCRGSGLVSRVDRVAAWGTVFVEAGCDTCDGYGAVECAKCIEEEETCRDCLEEQEWNRLNP